MTAKNPIDLRKVSLGATNVAAFAKKGDALAFAKSCGWQRSDVQWAYNRFWQFFVVTQVIADTRRILTKDAGWIDLPVTASA